MKWVRGIPVNDNEVRIKKVEFKFSKNLEIKFSNFWMKIQ